MSVSTFSHRFRRNPWPWLIGVLLLILTIMWIREYRTLLAESPGSKRLSTRTLQILRSSKSHVSTLNILVGPPQFVDPFGNLYFVFTKMNPSPVQKKISGSDDHISIITTNLDKSIGRSLTLDEKKGFSYFETDPKTDFILPLIFSALFLTSTALWFRNARRQCQPV